MYFQPDKGMEIETQLQPVHVSDDLIYLWSLIGFLGPTFC